jgi:D-amino-acid dehydrogenase
MLCKSARAFREEAHLAETARSLGLAADVLTAEAAARLDPGLRMEIAGAVYFPQDCHLSPPHFLAGLTRTLEREGATLRWCTEATGWRTAGDGGIEAVRTDHGDVPGDAFVLAGGAWSPALLRPLGVRLPLEAGKGYSFTLSHPKRLPALCSILTEARVAVTPMGAALRFAGTLEIGGRDRSIHRARVRNLLRAIPGYFPEFTADDFAGLPVWSGLRPCSPDGLPYVGRFARFENLCAATGHADARRQPRSRHRQARRRDRFRRHAVLRPRPLRPDRYAG